MQFARIIGIDLLRRANPDDELEGPARLSGRRRCAAAEVLPPPSPRKYWMRRGIAEWLVERERLAEDVPTLVGIDHGFSFPLSQSPARLADGLRGEGAARMGKPAGAG